MLNSKSKIEQVILSFSLPTLSPFLKKSSPEDAIAFRERKGDWGVGERRQRQKHLLVASPNRGWTRNPQPFGS